MVDKKGTAKSATQSAKTTGKMGDASGGIKAVLEQSLQSYDKLPMLEIILEKFVRQLSTSLRNLTSEAIDVSIEEFSSLRFGAYIDSMKNPFSIVVFKAVEWENLGLLIMENNMIFSFVDVLLGGKKSTTQGGEGQDFDRVLTSIEQGLARQIAEVMLGDLSQSFDQISPSSFVFERLESNPNFVSICRPGDAVIVVKLKIELDTKIKRAEIMIPYKTIEPIKEQMQQVFLGDKFGNDLEWETNLIKTLYDVEFSIEAVINEKLSTIKEIAELNIGDTFILDHKKDQDITIRSGNVELFTGRIGKVGDKMAVDLKELIED